MEFDEDPFLDRIEQGFKPVLLSAFASAVRTGEFIKGTKKNLAKDTVREALEQVAACFTAKLQSDPRHDITCNTDQLISL